MGFSTQSPAAIAAELGAHVVGHCDVTDPGKAQLEVLVAIMGALKLTAQLDNFLPPQDISPVQLAQLQGRKRQRASGQRSATAQEPPEW